jgi:hypothetical protein
MAKGNQNKTDKTKTNTTTAWKQSKSPLSEQNLLGKSTSKCEHCEARFTLYETFFEKIM